MINFKVTHKPVFDLRPTDLCDVCNKRMYEEHWRVGISEHSDWGTSAFVCSEECVNMFILMNMNNDE